MSAMIVALDTPKEWNAWKLSPTGVCDQLHPCNVVVCWHTTLQECAQIGIENGFAVIC